MVAGAIAGNISAEATTPTGNTFAEAMRGALVSLSIFCTFKAVTCSPAVSFGAKSINRSCSAVFRTFIWTCIRPFRAPHNAPDAVASTKRISNQSGETQPVSEGLARVGRGLLIAVRANTALPDPTQS
jgi:hypothetical protein